MLGSIPQKKLDLLFIITGLGVGGAEVQVSDLAIGLSGRGFSVAVMSMVSNGEVLERKLVKSGVHVLQLGMRGGKPSIFAFLSAAKVIWRTRPDIVHSHMFHSNLMARLLRLVAPMPRLVCSAHNSIEGGKFSMLAYRLTHGLGDVLTNVSEAASRELERRGAAPSGSILPVWNGIDTSKYHRRDAVRLECRRTMGWLDNQFVFLAVGRLVPQKDYPTLLAAMRDVVSVLPDAKLVIVGRGESELALRELSCTLGLEEVVVWLGERHDVDRLLNGADAFVLTSIYEGFGLVVAEAMASELPVVATRCFGPEEVLGTLSEVVEPGHVAGVASEMIRIARLSFHERSAWVRRARARAVSCFSLESIIDSWIGVYRPSVRNAPE